jgi:hypothetical protein
MYQIRGHDNDFPLVVKYFQLGNLLAMVTVHDDDHAEVVGIPSCSGSGISNTAAVAMA